MKGKSRYSVKEREFIFNLWETSNFPLSRIVRMVNDEFNTTRTGNGIRKLCNTYGVTRPNQIHENKLFSSEDLNMIFDLFFTHGLRVGVIAEKFDKEREVIAKEIRKEAVNRRNKGETVIY